MKDNLMSAPSKPDSGEVTPEMVRQYLQTFGMATELTPQETQQFIALATAFKLNPFKKEIHVVAYGYGESRKLSIVVGYEVYLKRAERTGKLDGWHAWIEGEGENARACVEIFRKDWSHPFHHDVYFSEAVQRKKDGTATSFWQKMPKFQLRKVAISQGFRLAFADELGGMPYESAELGEDPMPSPDQTTTTASTPEQARPARAGKPPSSRHLSLIPKPGEPSARPAKGSLPPMPVSAAKRLEIETILADHPKAFPMAHANWIRQELTRNPSDERLEEVLEHMKSVLAQSSLAQPDAELEEMPIF